MVRSVRLVLAGCAVLGSPSLVAAQGRPATTAMACAAARDFVARAGAVVMTTGPITYARLVRDGGFCPLPEGPKPAFERTLDDPQCFVGYTCQDKFNEGIGRD
ncbi:hypothetical protein [Methylobacterium sp. Leaf108]|uniref:hypothetical protein n=1 Tax=Methylobacterium sp. Leaf108 TaxID=1736256 RepID=UPI000B018D66|nr:hypothetical protein [Methylobacterium sp. Leaf108]